MVFGMGFMTLQALSYTAGYVTVNHAVIQSDVEDVLDVNDDGVAEIIALLCRPYDGVFLKRQAMCAYNAGLEHARVADYIGARTT